MTERHFRGYEENFLGQYSAHETPFAQCRAAVTFVVAAGPMRGPHEEIRSVPGPPAEIRAEYPSQ
jgi:hypothetical protein